MDVGAPENLGGFTLHDDQILWEGCWIVGPSRLLLPPLRSGLEYYWAVLGFDT